MSEFRDKLMRNPTLQAIDDASLGMWRDPDPLWDLHLARRHALWRVQCLMEHVQAIDNVIAGKEPRAGRRGSPDCSDCLSMSHCETHQKEDGTYPGDA